MITRVISERRELQIRLTQMTGGTIDLRHRGRRSKISSSTFFLDSGISGHEPSVVETGSEEMKREREEDGAARLGHSTRDSNNTVSRHTSRDLDGNQKRCTANASLRTGSNFKKKKSHEGNRRSPTLKSGRFSV